MLGFDRMLQFIHRLIARLVAWIRRVLGRDRAATIHVTVKVLNPRS